eukprot:12194495-Karenia_brevis.AAC.1
MQASKIGEASQIALFVKFCMAAKGPSGADRPRIVRGKPRIARGKSKTNAIEFGKSSASLLSA